MRRPSSAPSRSAALLAVLALTALAVLGATGPASAQAAARRAPATAARSWPARPIRHDIPMTDMIRRAFAAGTRDSTGRPGPNYWQLWTDYALQASLDPSTGVVTGHERVTVRNTSGNPMHAIVLRLYQNIFAPDAVRVDRMPSMTDGITLTSLSFDGEPVDLNPPPRRRFRRDTTPPKVILAAYDTSATVALITLPTPVAAHDSFTLEADWHFTVPKVPADERGERMGAWGDSLYQVGQWYPQVAMYDDLFQGGWDTDPYLGPSEFYNNFGHFDLRVSVPAGWVVGASGVLQNPDQVLTSTERERLSHVLESDSTVHVVGPDELGPGKATAAGDRLTWHFVADTVGDVGWAASNQFLWDATRATIPDRGPVPVNVMYLPGHAKAYAPAPARIRHALEFYSKLWIPYAFPVLTDVDGPELGMEYPMFIMSSTGASDHETGHQWWPMTLGTNETWYGFMDEGFNQYMNILSADDLRGLPVGPSLDGRGQLYGRVSGNEREAPLMWDANYGGPMYSFQAYGKAPMMLSMLGGIVGDSAVTRAMSQYAAAWRFKHPSPWDYAFFMDHALHRDLGWFWYSWLFTTDAVDGSIQGVQHDGTSTTVTVRQDGEMPSPVVLAVHFAPQGPAIRRMTHATMVDDSTAVVRYPVDVWFDGSRTFDAHLDFGPRKIDRIVLDPHCRFPDRDVADDTWPRQPETTAQNQGGRGMFGRPVCKG
ncbi:MAG: M1 family metallopeptidase [Candidatus Palauibacterales bacterium]|nr:M1 family metallopeptidase [Candidatus Palauibacterales bacterium]MDP2584012.1 M1 family metallopeptidase [Candidatus Palauibacterales bacterium]